MQSQLTKPTVFSALTATLSATIVVALLTYAFGQSEQKSAHQQLLNQLLFGTEKVAFFSSHLWDDEQALLQMKSAQDMNIAAFQKLQLGSIKDNLQPLHSHTDYNLNEINADFERFSVIAAEIQQARSTLERVKQGKEQYFQTVNLLIDKANGIVAGLSQFNPSITHQEAAYQTLMTLLQYENQLIGGFYQNNTIHPLDIDYVREQLSSLSTQAGAPKSSTIRRSAANLLAGIEENQEVSSVLGLYSEQRENLSQQVTELQKLQGKLKSHLNSISDQLESSLSLLIYVAMGFSLISAAALIYLGLKLSTASHNSNALPLSTPPPGPEAERTSQTELARFKTEKNLLMNDIKPLADGILYIKADEHLASTGDVARCLNQSRESLAKRISALQASAIQVQSELSENSQDSNALNTQPKFQLNTKPIEDLTFKANAELEGAQRKLKQLNHPDKEEIKAILLRTLRAERLLDEIRIRIRKGWADELIEQTNQPENPQQSEQINHLVGEIVRNLNEFKIQAPTQRHKRQ